MKKVFTPLQESSLEAYLLKSNDIYFGLSVTEVRKLAFDFAITLKIQYPQSWNCKKMAGPDWFSGFMKRHKKLSIRTPEATSLARATSFNPHNVGLFFNNLEVVIKKYNISPLDFWNFDECGVFTVQKPERVVGRRGAKQIGKLTSAERGTLVTLGVAVSAGGNCLPPYFVFPRVRYQEHWVIPGPLGSEGGANPSGWINEENFFNFMQMFVRLVRSSHERRVLLLLDNHDTHLSIKALDFARNNGVVMLSFPPHTSHRLQPLDVSVYGPLKRYVNSALDSWMLMHPGKTMTIYDIPGIIKETLPKAATPSNIMAGFKVSSFYPLLL